MWLSYPLHVSSITLLYGFVYDLIDIESSINECQGERLGVGLFSFLSFIFPKFWKIGIVVLVGYLSFGIFIINKIRSALVICCRIAE